MKQRNNRHWFALLSAVLPLSAIVALCFSYAPLVRAQSGDLQQRIADLKSSVAANKEQLAHYTWVETVTISLKGEQKKVQHFQVVIGPDGKPVKTSLDPAPAADNASGGRGGRVRQKIVAKKKEEYEDYADQMKAVAQQYLPPDKDLIQAAYAKGNVSFTPDAGVPGQIKILIHNYVKAGDSVTLVFDKLQKQLASINIATYLSQPSDAMNLAVTFARIPDGPSHIATTTIEGVSKQLTVATQNSDYAKQN